MSPDAVIDALKDLREAVERRTAQFRKMLYVLAFLILVVLLAVAFVLTIQSSNRAILQTVRSATTPNGEIYKRGQENQSNALALLDCMNRRIVAHLPSPSSPPKCFTETPAEVYPGRGTAGP